ncbi:hypothetical protein, partial [Pseudomonas aeruginosa]
MKKLLLGALLLVSATISNAESGLEFHKNATETYSKAVQENNSNVMVLNQIEAEQGCEKAKEYFEIVQFNSAVKTKYECKGENNYFSNVYEIMFSGISFVITIIISIVLLFIYFAKVKELIFTEATHNARGYSKAVVIAYNAIKLIVIAFFIPIGTIVILASLIAAGSLNKEYSDAQKISQQVESLPPLNAKNNQIENLINYLICVKTVESDKSSDPTIKLFSSSDDKLIFKATYSTCQVEGSLMLDSKGIAIAQKHNLFDYRQKQIGAVSDAFSTLISRLDQIAANIVKNGAVTGIKTLPEDITGEQLYVFDISNFEYDELAKYKSKAVDYHSQELIFDLNKSPSITKDKITKQLKKFKHSRIDICSDEEPNSNRYTLEQIRFKAEQCVSRNCSDIESASSPYACSVALEKYNQAMTNKQTDFYTTPQSAISERKHDYTSAKLLTNTIGFNFFIIEEPIYTVDYESPIKTFSVSLANGQLTNNRFKDFLEATDNYRLNEESKNEKPFDLTNLLTTEEGFLSLDRFFTCLANPYQIKEGYECKGLEYELERQSNVFTFTALKMQAANIIHSGKLDYFIKTKKAKDNVSDVVFSNKSASEMLDKLKPLIKEKRHLALITPMLFDSAGVFFEDVYGDEYKYFIGDNATFYAAMAIMYSSESGSNIISMISGTLHTFAQFLSYGHILIPVMIFLFAVLKILLTKFLGLSVQQIKIAMTFADNKPSRGDLDKEDYHIFLEEWFVRPVILVISYYISIVVVKLIIGYM